MDPRPFSREAQEWLADYLIRAGAVLGPLVGAFLIYRWSIGLIAPNLAALSLILLPFAVLPWFSHRIKLKTKARVLLGVFSVSAATTFEASGLLGVGPLLSILSAFTALVFFGNRVFLSLLAAITLAVGLSGLAHFNGLYEMKVDLSYPINVFGRTLTVTFVMFLVLRGLQGATRLVAEQREFAKRKSRALEGALDDLNQLIDSANAPIFGVDTEGRVNEWNATTARLTGYSREEALGNDLVETYITAEYKQSVGHVLESALAGRGVANYELPLFSKAGERLEVLLNATTRRGADGSIVGVIGVGQDITGFREQEKRLRQAQKMESVSHLTGGIAHDFNNLLSVIQGNLDLALNDLGGLKEVDFVKDCLGDAAVASADAEKLTSQLLAFSSQQSFRQETVNLRSVISESLRKSSSHSDADGIFSIDVDGVDLAVVVDSAQLESAIVRLVENATESIGPAGKISVKASIELMTGDLSSEYSLRAGEYIVITVSDDGRGIEKGDLPKVKEPFFSTKKMGEGTGLGLSVVHGFVKKAGGELRIQSEVGVGTRVDLVLPLTRGEDGAHAHGVGEERVEFSQQTGTVLVVDDEELLRKLAARHLTSTGFKVIEAGDAEEALVLLAQNNGEIDVLLSDIRMPGPLTGRQLAEEVSRLYPGVRMLLTTGYEEEAAQSTDENRSLGRKVPVLRKPYSKSELIGAVIGLD